MNDNELREMYKDICLPGWCGKVKDDDLPYLREQEQFDKLAKLYENSIKLAMRLGEIERLTEDEWNFLHVNKYRKELWTKYIINIKTIERPLITIIEKDLVNLTKADWKIIANLGNFTMSWPDNNRNKLIYMKQLTQVHRDDYDKIIQIVNYEKRMKDSTSRENMPKLEEVPREKGGIKSMKTIVDGLMGDLFIKEKEYRDMTEEDFAVLALVCGGPHEKLTKKQLYYAQLYQVHEGKMDDIRAIIEHDISEERRIASRDVEMASWKYWFSSGAKGCIDKGMIYGKACLNTNLLIAFFIMMGLSSMLPK